MVLHFVVPDMMFAFFSFLLFVERDPARDVPLRDTVGTIGTVCPGTGETKVNKVTLHIMYSIRGRTSLQYSSILRYFPGSDR